MKTALPLTVRGIVIGLVSAISVGLAAILSVLTVIKARMPYNEQGRYFDGEVVHHADAVLVLGGFAIVCWLIALIAGYWAYRTFRPAKPRNT